MINTYTCIPNQTSPETVFEDLKTFFEDKWTWSKIETNYPDSESTDYNTLTFWIDTRLPKKTDYSILNGIVGSVMCIRDRVW